MNKKRTLGLPKLITKKRLPISIRFNIRPNYNILQCRVSVDGVEGSLFNPVPNGKPSIIASGIWAQKDQKRTDRTQEATDFNKLLREIVNDLETICDRQRKGGYQPTPKSIQWEFQTGRQYEGLEFARESKYSALNCYRTYLKELESGGLPEKVLVKTTLDKWHYGLAYLERYIAETHDADPLSTASADQLTLFWGKSYHRWLMKTGPMSAESATRYIKRLIEAITHIAESGAIKQNPLANLELSRAKTKDVYFLEPHHLEKFWQLDLPKSLGVSCWWMGVIFLTGLDYPDAVRYVQNRDRYERVTIHGDKIVIHRSKPPKAECHIPMSAELKALLQYVPIGLPPSYDKINEHMRVVEVLIGFEHRLTCKVGRKTAGAIFYDKYENAGVVSRIMGHSSIAITERYYLKTTGYTVDKAMQKQFVKESPDEVFRRVA